MACVIFRQIRRAEAEISRLSRELKGNEALHEEIVTTLRAEVQKLERQLAESRQFDGGRGGQLNAMERALSQEREGREKALSEAKELRRQMESLAQELQEAKRAGSRQDNQGSNKVLYGVCRSWLFYSQSVYDCVARCRLTKWMISDVKLFL